MKTYGNVLIIPSNLYWEANPIGLLSLVRFYKHFDNDVQIFNEDEMITTKIYSKMDHRGNKVIISMSKEEYIDQELYHYHGVDESTTIKIIFPYILNDIQTMILSYIFGDIEIFESFEIVENSQKTTFNIIAEQYIDYQEIIQIIVKGIIMSDYEILNFHTYNFPRL